MNLIIKSADKNLGLTIMDKSWYEFEVTNHLKDSKYYEIKNPDKFQMLNQLETILKMEPNTGKIKKAIWPKTTLCQNSM